MYTRRGCDDIKITYRKITTEDLEKLFPAGVPIIAMKILFPEKSEPLTNKELWDVITMIAEHRKTAPPEPGYYWIREFDGEPRLAELDEHGIWRRATYDENDWYSRDNITVLSERLTPPTTER